MGRDLIAIIDAAMPRFSKGQKRIGNFIREQYQKAAFMTASKLGETVGVSESTVVRFATEIGFEGYPQLQKALQEMTRNRLTSVQRMEVTNDRIGNDDVLTKVLHTDIEKIKRTLEEVDKDMFDAAVNSIIEAKSIYIIGIRSASVLSGFMNYYFNHIFSSVRTIDTASTSGIFEQMLHIGSQDVFIGITFSRYSKRTIKAATYARNCGAKVVAITDSLSAPICAVADYVLIAKSDMASFVDSLVAPLSLINALIVAIGLKRKDEISSTYAKLEKIWSDYSVYETGDDSEDERE